MRFACFHHLLLVCVFVSAPGGKKFRLVQGFASVRLRLRWTYKDAASFPPSSQPLRLFSQRQVTNTENESSSSSSSNKNGNKIVPITLLAGFPGSGKSTIIRNILENNDGLKLGIIVANDDDDLATMITHIESSSGSIDSSDSTSALSPPSSSEPPPPDNYTVELRNGCVLHKPPEGIGGNNIQNLLTSVEKLLFFRDSGDGREYENGNNRGGEGEQHHNRRRDLDAIVVELNGVADPVEVRQNWIYATTNTNANANDDQQPERLAFVNNIVTVLDASTVGTDWVTLDKAGNRKGWPDPTNKQTAHRPIPELLAEQVEAADIVVFNKADNLVVATNAARLMAGDSADNDENRRAAASRAAVVISLTRSLNAKAQIFEAKFGNVPVREVLGIVTEDAKEELPPRPVHPSSRHRLNDDDDDELIHIDTFRYTSNRPFIASRLRAIAQRWPTAPVEEEVDLLGWLSLSVESVEGRAATQSPFAGVLRSKGVCWTSPTKWNGPGSDAWRHDAAMYWGNTGPHFSIVESGRWWATISREEMKACFQDNDENALKEYHRILEEDFVTEEFGDRRQELVFFGGDSMDQEKIVAALDECLATDEEMKHYREQAKKMIAA